VLEEGNCNVVTEADAVLEDAVHDDCMDLVKVEIRRTAISSEQD
jgi:hypothetical protein